MKILIVCMGNICRSPTVEGVLRSKLAAAGLNEVIVDSAGTHAYHIGEPPDMRSTQYAMQRGYDLRSQRARQVRDADFTEFDLILAADNHNLNALQERCPKHLQYKLKRVMDYAPKLKVQELPDPYYGGGRGFETVLNYAEVASDGLIAVLQSTTIT